MPQKSRNWKAYFDASKPIWWYAMAIGAATTLGVLLLADPLANPQWPQDNDNAKDAFLADGWSNVTFDRKDRSANELEADCPQAIKGGEE